MTSSHDISAALAEFRHDAGLRRSVYSYLETPVPSDLLLQALETSALAPNHHRTMPWRFHVFADGARAQLAQAYTAAAVRLQRDVVRAVQRAYDAPTMVVIACVPSVSNAKVKVWEEEFATAAATQNLMLALGAAGLGSLLTTGDLAESPEVRTLIQLDQPQARLMGVLNVGYRNPDRPLVTRPQVDTSAFTRWYPQA